MSHDDAKQHTPASLADVLERDYFPMPDGKNLYLNEYEWRMVVKALRAAPPTAKDEYARLNPLGGPARMFRAIAERLEAGEEYMLVLADYGLVHDAPVSEKPAIPGGWKLVPVEPTREMHNLAHQSEPKAGRQARGRIYKAMLAAAPSPTNEKQSRVATDSTSAGKGEA